MKVRQELVLWIVELDQTKVHYWIEYESAQAFDSGNVESIHAIFYQDGQKVVYDLTAAELSEIEDEITIDWEDKVYEEPSLGACCHGRALPDDSPRGPVLCEALQ
jgi:hypothetical protein